jgi:hypothetical protein
VFLFLADHGRTLMALTRPIWFAEYRLSAEYGLAAIIDKPAPGQPDEADFFRAPDDR